MPWLECAFFKGLRTFTDKSWALTTDTVRVQETIYVWGEAMYKLFYHSPSFFKLHYDSYDSYALLCGFMQTNCNIPGLQLLQVRITQA